MIQLTPKQQQHAEQIIRDTTELRKRVTLYKKNCQAYAQFRVTTMNYVETAILCKVTGKKLPVKTKKFITYWENDLGIGKDIVALFNAIEEASNL